MCSALASEGQTVVEMCDYNSYQVQKIVTEVVTCEHFYSLMDSHLNPNTFHQQTFVLTFFLLFCKLGFH